MENAIDHKPKFCSPASVLREVELRAGDVVIDYGAGTGHWTIPAGLIVGEKGKVHAIEENAELLNILKGKAAIRNLKNIDVEELNLVKENSEFAGADLIIVANVLHAIKEKEEFGKRVINRLKDDGKLLVVDWVSGKKLFGPPEDLRMKEEKVISLFETLGLHFVCIVDAGWHHYGLVFDRGRIHEKRKAERARNN